MSSDLSQSILRTVSWFSLFEIPVTVFEIWRWMIGSAPACGLDDVYAALEGEGLRSRLAEKDGLWTLAGRPIGTMATERRARFLDAARKYGKLRRATRYLSRVPGVMGIAAGNSLAWWNTRQDSDIDLFVVTRPGMIWTARFLCVLPFALLGKRPRAFAFDPFCFSFFATTEALDLSPLRLEGGDPYLDYWIRSVVPVFDRGGLFEKFWETNNVTTPNPSLKRRGDTCVSPPFQGGFKGWFVRFVESLARRVQLRRLPSRIREMMNVDSRVVVTDSMLKFHDRDRREEYRDALSANGECGMQSAK